MQTGPDGRIYWSSLYGAANLAPAALIIRGVQVAVSSDGGLSWDTNIMVDLESHGLSGANSDRQYLGFADDGRVFLSVNNFNPSPMITPSVPGHGIYMATSTDGGASFGPFSQVVDHADRGGQYNNGGRPVEMDGTIAVFHTDLEDSGPHDVALATSTDGSSWTQTVIEAAGESQPVRLHQDAVGHGRIVGAWITNEDVVQVISSDDVGRTWSEVIPLGPGNLSPWIEATPSGFAVTWMDGNTAWLATSDATANDWALIQLGQTSTDAISSDIASLAVNPAGDIGITWADTNLEQLHVVVVSQRQS